MKMIQKYFRIFILLGGLFWNQIAFSQVMNNKQEVLSGIESVYSDRTDYQIEFSSSHFENGRFLKSTSGITGKCETEYYSKLDYLLVIKGEEESLTVNSKSQSIQWVENDEPYDAKYLFNGLFPILSEKLRVRSLLNGTYTLELEGTYFGYDRVLIKVDQETFFVEKVIYASSSHDDTVETTYSTTLKKSDSEFQIDTYIKKKSERILLKKEYEHYTLISL